MELVVALLTLLAYVLPKIIEATAAKREDNKRQEIDDAILGADADLSRKLHKLHEEADRKRGHPRQSQPSAGNNLHTASGSKPSV